MKEDKVKEDKVLFVINHTASAKKYVSKGKKAVLVVPYRVVTDSGVLISENYAECTAAVIAELKKNCNVFKSDIASGGIEVVEKLPEGMKTNTQRLEDLHKQIETLSAENAALRSVDVQVYIAENEELKKKCAELEAALSALQKDPERVKTVKEQ